jgi:hypothetical protein
MIRIPKASVITGDFYLSPENITSYLKIAEIFYLGNFSKLTKSLLIEDQVNKAKQIGH